MPVILKTFLSWSPTIKPQCGHDILATRNTVGAQNRAQSFARLNRNSRGPLPPESIRNGTSDTSQTMTQQIDETPLDFTFWINQEVRFRDLDTLKHVNHTVYFIYAEMARLEYYRQVLEMDLMNELAFLMLDIQCRYIVAAEFGDTLRVGFRIDWLKRSSSGFSFQIVGPDGRLFAEGKGIQVYVDLESRRPQPIPRAMRAKMLAFDRDVKEVE